MKKISSFLYFVLIIVISLFIAYSYDARDSKKYTIFDVKSRLIISEKDGMSQKALNTLVDSLHDNIKMSKYSYQDDFTAVFLNVDSYEALVSLLDKHNISVRYTNECSEGCFIATYQTEDSRQYGISADFMANQNIRYYLMRDLESTGFPLFGTYYFDSAATEYLDPVYRSIETASISGTIQIGDITSMQSSSASDSSMLLVLLCVVVASLFVTSIVNDTLSSTKRISVMKMLGYSYGQISRSITKSGLIVVVLSTSISVIIAQLLARTFDVNFIKLIIGTNVVVIVLYLILAYLIVLSMSQSISIVTSLRNKRYTSKIVDVSMILKLVLGFVLLSTSLSLIVEINSVYDEYQSNNKYAPLKNIAYFGGTIPGSQELGWDELWLRAHEFYVDISKNSNIKYVLANFVEYVPIYNPEAFYNGVDEELAKSDQEQYVSWAKFPYAKVDSNYLKLNNIVAYKSNGEKLQLDTPITSAKLLIPISHQDKTDKIIEIMNKGTTTLDYYFKNIDIVESIYYYDDQALPTYNDYVSDTLKVESPIMAIIESNFALPYTESGVLVMGGDSEIKFIIDEYKDKVELFEELRPFLERNGLKDEVTLGSLVTYGDEYGEISNERWMYLIQGISMFSTVLFVYWIVSAQLNKLYLESEIKEIAVAKQLGYSHMQVYGKLYALNSSICFFTILLTVSVYLIQNKDINIIWSVPIIILIITESIIGILFIRYVDKKRVASILRGEL